MGDWGGLAKAISDGCLYWPFLFVLRSALSISLTSVLLSKDVLAASVCFPSQLSRLVIQKRCQTDGTQRRTQATCFEVHPFDLRAACSVLCRSMTRTRRQAYGLRLTGPSSTLATSMTEISTIRATRRTVSCSRPMMSRTTKITRATQATQVC